MASVLGGEQESVGADALAWDVAIALEASISECNSFGLLALGWNKAYDGVILGMLEDILATAGCSTGQGYAQS